VVAASLTAWRGRAGALAVALLAAALLAAMAVTGAIPKLANFVRFEPAGVMPQEPEQITRVELRSGQQTLVFTREGDGWLAGGTPLSAAALEHMTRALRFLHVSRPTATLGGDGIEEAALVDMGLAPPQAEVTLFAGAKRVLAVRFGGVNPSAIAQYARLAGQSGILLLPLHVGREWRVLARTLPDHVASAPPGAGDAAWRGVA
jgi:hypothetical protein